MKEFKYGILCFIPSLIALLFWNELPTTIAMHFDFAGNVNGVTNRIMFVFGIPLLGCIGHSAYMWILYKKPSWIGRKGVRKYSFLYFPILTACTMALLYINS